MRTNQLNVSNELLKKMKREYSRKAVLTQGDVIRRLSEEKATILKDGAGWVVFYGMSFAPRSSKVPPELKRAGIQHCDIYYAFEEECPWSIAKNIADDESISEAIIDSGAVPQDQLTYMKLATPYPETVRAWAGEVRLISNDLLLEMVNEGYLEVISFTSNMRSGNPVWDEATRDMIGALMLDGLDYIQAQNELTLAGVEFDKDTKLPSYFYRAIGEYANTFKED